MQPLLADVPDFVARLQPALVLLLEARACAHDTGQDVWEFALEIAELASRGLGKNELRWLVHKGYAAHAVETTRDGRSGRRFRKPQALVLSTRSCLVLTDRGAAVARELQRGSADSPPNCRQIDTLAVPRWDASARLLSFAGVVVKQFKVPAANQELILAAFQEEGWPAQIDDPLSPVAEIDAKRRLHDAINRLNRNQRNALIRFCGNGNGRAIRWVHKPGPSLEGATPVRHHAAGGIQDTGS